jgi:chromosome segregation ATPase
MAGIPHTRPLRDWYEKWSVTIASLSLVVAALYLAYTYVHNMQISEADRALQAQLEHSNSAISEKEKMIGDLSGSNSQLQTEIAVLQTTKETLEKGIADAKELENDTARKVKVLEQKLLPPTINFSSQASTEIADALASPKAGELPATRLIKERDKLLESLKASGADIAQAIDALDDEFDQIDGVLKNPPVDNNKLANIMQKLNDTWKTKKEILDGRVRNAITRLGCHPGTS